MPHVPFPCQAGAGGRERLVAARGAETAAPASRLLELEQVSHVQLVNISAMDDRLPEARAQREVEALCRKATGERASDGARASARWGHKFLVRIPTVPPELWWTHQSSLTG